MLVLLQMNNLRLLPCLALFLIIENVTIMLAGFVDYLLWFWIIYFLLFFVNYFIVEVERLMTNRKQIFVSILTLASRLLYGQSQLVSFVQQ